MFVCLTSQKWYSQGLLADSSPFCNDVDVFRRARVGDFFLMSNLLNLNYIQCDH